MDGHDFSKGGYCASCGIGRPAYENHKPVCRNFIDVRMLMYRLVDRYLDAGGDPDMVIISRKDLASLTTRTIDNVKLPIVKLNDQARKGNAGENQN